MNIAIKCTKAVWCQNALNLLKILFDLIQQFRKLFRNSLNILFVITKKNLLSFFYAFGIINKGAEKRFDIQQLPLSDDISY